jgi:hypothetical protein
MLFNAVLNQSSHNRHFSALFLSLGFVLLGGVLGNISTRIILMKKLLVTSAVALICALGARAQNTNVVIPPGKLAVFKAGDDTGYWNISTSRVQPCFVQVFDEVTNNQAEPLYSLDLPTNAPNGIWINAHAGSEGGGISRAVNREYLALQGYTGNILSPTNAKPSSDTTVTRGFGIVDVFGNEQVLYSDPANWFGLPPGVTQNNPTGIATEDGTNFWGTGNVTGTSVEAAGTLFYNAQESATPIELQNYIQAAAEARIIGGTLYIVVPGQGIYNFLDPQNNDAVVPLPYDPNVPNPVEHIVLTNLFLNWGSTFQNIANFDMNAAGTIAYGADQTFGVVKFVNEGGSWQQAPYYFSATNIGTLAQVAANQGCFGICVDFSGANPIIYATTMENGTGTNSNDAQGNANQNRIVRIVDTGVNPGTNLVAQTLATAVTTNEVFRGIDFTPDVTPLITSEPAPYATITGGTAFFTVTAQSVYPLSYQWLQNGTNLMGANSATLTLSGVALSLNTDEYQCIVSNAYGVVTSMPPAELTVTETAQSPTITGPPGNVTNFVDGNVTFAAVSPTGTEPFTFQWYFGGIALTNGGEYEGALSSSLSISNVQPDNAGSYYLVVSNSAGFASNLVDVLTVLYYPPSVAAGEPASATAFLGSLITLTANAAGGTPPLTYQWYYGAAALHDVNEYSGSAASSLTINPVTNSDAGSYTLVISNPGGSVTSQVAVLTVLAPPPPSYVAYSNQVYFQNFNSLPDPGSNSVNSINNPKDPGSIDGIAYSLANPFDFAYPVITSSFLGGLGLASTMPGWYGAADTLFTGVVGITRFAAQDGDQTTGGVIDFGPNDNGTNLGTNRALGLLSTGTTGSTTFALKLINETTTPITNVSMSFTGEMWHNGTTTRTMSFGYTEDSTATNFTLTAESITNAVLASNLFFSFPIAPVVTTVDGTQSSNQIDLATNGMILATPWTPGGALWLIWSINYYGSGSGNGYAIDNLTFSNASPPAAGPAGPSYVAYDNAASNYTQNFNSLPYQPTTSVNTANPVTVDNTVYSLADPFDFAEAVASNGSGGLGLSGTMNGWYGLGNVLSRYGATAGDQTTGGDLSFGPTNSATAATNRSLGLLATGSTGPTAFGVRFVNMTGYTLGEFNLAYSSELWRQTTTAKTVTNFYYVDYSGTNGFLTNIVAGSLTNLAFATGATAYGTNGPVSSNYVVFTNQSIAGSNWPSGAALWVIWEMDNSAGSGQGLGIDNLAFSADLATNLAPEIITPPLSQSVSDGGTASFSVLAAGVLSGTYQWYTNGVALANKNEFSGVNTSTLTINPAVFADAANYTVVVSNVYGSVTSTPVTLTVNVSIVPPAFSLQPLSQTNYVSSNTTLVALATGAPPITYQWQFDGANIPGATATDLVLNNLALTNTGTYTLVASNTAGTNVSQPAILTVLDVPPSIVTEPLTQLVIVGGAAVFSVSATGTAPLTYQWMFDSTALSDGIGILGSQSNVLTLTNVQFSQGGNYSVLVSNGGGSSNSTAAVLIVGPTPSYIAYSNAAAPYAQNFDSLPYQPTSSTNTENPAIINGVVYSLSDPMDFAFPDESLVTGGLGLSNAMAGWYGLGNVLERFGATAGDQTTGGQLSFGPTNTAAAAANRSLGLIATSSTGPTAFGIRLLNLTGYTLGQFNLAYSSELWRQTTTAKTVTNFYYLDLSGTNGFLTNIVTGSLTNLAFATGTTAYGTNGPVVSNYVAFTNQSFTSNWPSGAALWVIWEMPSAAGSGQGIGIDNLEFSADLATNLEPVITTEPSSQTVTAGQPASFNVVVSSLLSGTYQWYSNNVALANVNEFSGSTSSTLMINPTAFSDAATYTVVISNVYGSATSVPVALSVSAAPVPPTFSVQPLSQTNLVGANIVLSAAVTGTLPITYQWQFDGTNILGATTNSLALNNVIIPNSGTYTLAVSNVAGTNISQPAFVTVVAQSPLLLTQPLAQTVVVGGTAVFSVSVTGTSPFQYQWLFGNLNLSDGNGIVGSQSNTLTLTNVQFSEGGYYSVFISNAGGVTNSASVVLTVIPGPSFVAYSNANSTYAQNFDSLPYEPTTSVNTANPVTINNEVYSLGDPFDFAFTAETNGSGGLGLSNSMAGWYGLANAVSKFGVTAGDQTTGGALSFGPTNTAAAAANRSLGLLATSTTGPTAFGVRFLNMTGSNLGGFNLAYSGELWRQTATPKAVTNFYYLDYSGTDGLLTNIVSGTLTNLTFATGNSSWGTNGPVSSNYVVFTNQALAINWLPGTALWFVWEMDDSTGGGQGIGIDNMTFSASVGVAAQPVQLNITESAGSVLVWWASSGGTNLQVTTDLTKPWGSAGLPVTSANLTNSVTVPIGAGSQYFRLVQ